LGKNKTDFTEPYLFFMENYFASIQIMIKETLFVWVDFKYQQRFSEIAYCTFNMQL